MMFRTHTIESRLIERFIFNFRTRPEVLTSCLPVAHLRPQLLDGWGVVSFCMLTLDHVTLAPLPSWIGLRTTSCAYRCGVIDASGAQPEPSVYIFKRYTDHPLISYLGPRVFATAMHKVRFSQTRDGAVRTVRVHDDRQCLFSASIQPSVSPNVLDSQVFDSLDAFARFINLGGISYTPAITGGALARVDLHKSDTHYTAFDGTVERSLLDDLWPNADWIFDSVVLATGGLYKWTYQGLVERSSDSCSSQMMKRSVSLA